MTLPSPEPGERIERRTSLKDLAYQEIKALLVAGRLAPDRLYSAQHFAQVLGVSRTPVREALLRLANEGFLVCREVKGFQVRQFTAREIRDVLETRRIIEVHVIGCVAARLSGEDLARLRQCQQRMTECAARKDAVGFIEADQEFHTLLVRSRGNLHLAAIIDNIRCQLSLFGLQALMHAGRFQEVIREHARILHALVRKDRKSAVQAMRLHLATTRNYMLGERTPTET
jgi:DNA-binding GntR family transcriptional regulator